MGEIFRKKPLRRTLKTVYEDINNTIDNLELGVVCTVANTIADANWKKASLS